MLEGSCWRKTAAAKAAGSYCSKTLRRQKRHMWLLEQEMDMVNWLGKFSRDGINAKSSEPRRAILLPREGTIRLELQSIFRSEPFPKAECSPLICSSSSPPRGAWRTRYLETAAWEIDCPLRASQVSTLHGMCLAVRNLEDVSGETASPNPRTLWIS